MDPQEDTKKQIEINRPSFKQGGLWILRAFDLFAQKPAFWNMFVVALFFVMFLIQGVFGVFAPILVFFIVPFSSSIALLTAEHLDLKIQEPLGGHVQSGLKNQQHKLIALGFICVGVALILGFVERFVLTEMGIDLSQYTVDNRPPVAVSLKALAVGLIVFLPLYLGMFFSCALIIFRGLPAWNAFLLSLSASLVCWRALLSYGLILTLLIAAPVGLFTFVYNITSAIPVVQSLLSLLGMIAFVILLLIVSAVTMIVSYIAFCDVFGRKSAEQEPDQVLSEF